jgi:hypothetical protein
MISNIAESDNMQYNYAPNSIPFAGFSQSVASENLQHAVPGLATRATFDIGSYSLYLEYITAMRSFSPLDMTYNNHGAKPSAFHSELVKTFNLHNKPSSIAFAYDCTKDALALLLPKQSVAGVFNISLWRDTVLSFEYRHAKNYGTNDVATGAGSIPFTSPESGHSNTFIAQFALYF